ncbi:MAG: hypothetical protein ACFFD4_20420 [Candidatus Odinarchaeota archaeon]
MKPRISAFPAVNVDRNSFKKVPLSGKNSITQVKKGVSAMGTVTGLKAREQLQAPAKYSSLVF